MSRAFFSKPRPFFAVSTLRRAKLMVGCQKLAKHCLILECFGLFFLNLATFVFPNLAQPRNPTPKVLKWPNWVVKWTGNLNDEILNWPTVSRVFFQNSYKNVELSFTPPQNPRHVNKSPYSILCFRCFCMFYRKCKNLGKWKVRQTTNHRQCWWVLVVGGLSHF